MYHNDLANDHQYEIENKNSSAVDARYNWWGDAATSQMDGGNNPKNITRLYDIFDNGGRGSVDYSQWLTSAHALSAEPLSNIIEPVDGLESKGGIITIKGIASSPTGVDYVEVSLDNGQSWLTASGKTRWSYSWENPADGSYTIRSRVIDLDGNIETPGAGNSALIDTTLPTTSGTLSSDENWSGAIVLTGDVTVPEHIILNIAAGTTIKFQALSDDKFSGANTSRSELIINGTLTAAGSATSPILFTSSSSTPAKADWGGIRVLNRGTLNLAFATIEYATNGIDYSLSSGLGEMSVVNCLIRYLSEIGIKTTVANENTVFTGTFTGNEIHDTNGNGMNIYTHAYGRSEVKIRDNTIHQVTEYGLHVYGYDHAETNALIENNEIYDTTTGLYLYNYYYSTSSKLNIDANRIHDNTTGIYCYFRNHSTGDPVFKGNIVYNNNSYGVRLYLYSNYSTVSPSLYNNSISNNSTGVHFERNSNGSIRPEIIFNTITGNASAGILLKDTSNAVFLYNDIQGNGGTGIDLQNADTSYVYHNNLANDHLYEIEHKNYSAVDARYNC